MKELKSNRPGSRAASRFIKDIPAWLLILPSLCLLFLICWRPIFMGVKMSFFGNDGSMFVGFENYKTVIGDTLFLKALKNTVLYVVWSLVVGLFIPVIVAIMLNETVHLNSFLKASLYLPQVVPTVAASLLWYFVYLADDAGLLNMVLGLFGAEPYVWLQNERITILLIIVMMTWKGFGFTSIMYLASIQGINRELYEAAMIDSVGIICRTTKITLPNMYPMILLFAINQVKNIFNIMFEPLTMTGGGPNNASLSLGLQSYKYAFQYFRMADSVALSTVMWVIIMMFTVIYVGLDRKLEQ